MAQAARYIAPVVVLIGLVSVAIGATFIAQAVAKNNFMGEAMRLEKVTLGLDESAVASGELIDSGGEAQVAGDTVREHRRGIASTYDELLAGGRYDPTNPEQLQYAQALNMENYLYLAVLGFGVTTVVTVSGVFMIITGIALGATGVVLFGLARKMSSDSPTLSPA